MGWQPWGGGVVGCGDVVVFVNYVRICVGWCVCVMRVYVYCSVYTVRVYVSFIILHL